MTVYIDELRNYGPQNGLWCHLWSDGDLAELNFFAAQLGLKREWLHVSRGLSGEFAHYDLRPNLRRKALRLGAEYMPLKDWIKSRVKP